MLNNYKVYYNLSGNVPELINISKILIIKPG